MSAVDLTKCQPGDLLTIRNGERAFYVRKQGRDRHTISGKSFDGYVSDAGLFFWKQECAYDVVAILHPTRAELEGQRLELLEACKAFLQNYDEDIYAVDMLPYIENIGVAVAIAEATHE